MKNILKPKTNQKLFINYLPFKHSMMHNIPPTSERPPSHCRATCHHLSRIGTSFVVSFVTVTTLGTVSTRDLKMVSVRTRSTYFVRHLSVPCCVTTMESRSITVSTRHRVCKRVSRVTFSTVTGTSFVTVLVVVHELSSVPSSKYTKNIPFLIFFPFLFTSR